MKTLECRHASTRHKENSYLTGISGQESTGFTGLEFKAIKASGSRRGFFFPPNLNIEMPTIHDTDGQIFAWYYDDCTRGKQNDFSEWRDLNSRRNTIVDILEWNSRVWQWNLLPESCAIKSDRCLFDSRVTCGAL